MERVKYRAKGSNMSVNAYVESVLNEVTSTPPIPKLPKGFEIDPLVQSLSGCIPAPTQEMLESDDRLTYLLSK